MTDKERFDDELRARLAEMTPTQLLSYPGAYEIYSAALNEAIMADLKDADEVEAEETEDEKRFHMFYRCPNDGEEWEDYWSCACDDRCPKCNAEIEPYKYEEKDEEGNYHE